MNMIVGWLFFLIIGVLLVFFPIMIGIYVYRDANRRGMNAVLWTLITVLAPSLIGLIIYLIVRADHSALQCPNCKGPVTEQYTVCPQCGTQLKHKCVKCEHALEASWQICPNCGEPVPEDLKVPLVNVHKDKGLGKILLAVILIPLLIISLLIVGLVAFRGSFSSSIGEVNGMRVEDFADNKVVADWLESCDTQGNGIYVLTHQQAAAAGSGTESYYVIYRKGLTSSVDVSADAASRGLFTSPALKIKYIDSGLNPSADYHIYQVNYFTSDVPGLEIYVNGKKVDFNLTTTPDPISVINPLLMKNDAANLFDAKIDYLGDNSGVSRLIKETGLAQVGQYTIELKTDQEPYGIRIIFTSTMKEFGIIDFSSNAIELLGLIKNLDYVEITDGVQTYKLTEQEASEILGFDVKELGRSYDKLAEYYNKLLID